jgi:hypothetical protein
MSKQLWLVLLRDHLQLLDIRLLIVNEIEYVGKRQIVKIEQLATKQDNNNLKHIFVAYIFWAEKCSKKVPAELSRGSRKPKFYLEKQAIL